MIRKLRNVSSNPNSLMITIPRYIVEMLKLNANQDVEVELKGKKIIIQTIEENNNQIK